MSKKRAAILGATGFTGVELLRLLSRHSEIEVVYATGDSQAGQRLARAAKQRGGCAHHHHGALVVNAHLRVRGGLKLTGKRSRKIGSDQSRGS